MKGISQVMDEVKIAPGDNGPYIVKGPVRIIDAAGNEYQITKKTIALWLCRCGGSSNKPFCDGIHSKIGFSAVTRASQS